MFLLEISAFLVKYMERRSCELQFDDTFVFKTLQEIGVTVSKLHEIYDRLFKSKVHFLSYRRDEWPEDCFDRGNVLEQSTHLRQLFKLFSFWRMWWL